MQNDNTSLAELVRKYAATFEQDTASQVGYALNDIAARVQELEEELDEAFRAGMAFAMEIIEKSGAEHPLIDEVTEAINTTMSRVETVVTTTKERTAFQDAADDAIDYGIAAAKTAATSIAAKRRNGFDIDNMQQMKRALPRKKRVPFAGK